MKIIGEMPNGVSIESEVPPKYRWMILYHFWLAACLYAIVRVVAERQGAKLGALPTLLTITVAYWGAQRFTATVDRSNFSASTKCIVRWAVGVGAFPASVVIAYTIGNALQ